MLLDNITVIDFETTGLNPKEDRIIEIAAIRCDGDQIVSQFSTTVQFDGELSPKITEITGLRQEDLQVGLDEETAMRILNRFIGKNTIVAHNAQFDLSFLHYTLLRLAGRSFNNHFIDTLTICRERHDYPHKLEDMCSRYNILMEQSHRALIDAINCWELLKKLNAEESVSKFINKLCYVRKYGEPNWVPPHAVVEAIDLTYAKKGND